MLLNGIINREQVYAFKRFSDRLDILCKRFLVKKEQLETLQEFFEVTFRLVHGLSAVKHDINLDDLFAVEC